MLKEILIATLGILVFVFVPGYVLAETEWLGAYKGGLIPGYEILQSELQTSSFFGKQNDEIQRQLLEYMKTQCVKSNGHALVNVSLTPAIGEVKYQSRQGQAQIVSPGLHLSGLADCVLKYQKKAP